MSNIPEAIFEKLIMPANVSDLYKPNQNSYIYKANHVKNCTYLELLSYIKDSSAYVRFNIFSNKNLTLNLVEELLNNETDFLVIREGIRFLSKNKLKIKLSKDKSEIIFRHALKNIEFKNMVNDCLLSNDLESMFDIFDILEE